MLYGKKIIGTIAYMGGVMTLPEPFVWSWSQMVEYNSQYLVEPNERIFYTRTTNSYHSFARNTLIDSMKGDWILMLDTDHQFEPDLSARMIYYFEKDNLDILTGIYQYVTPPYYPKIYRFDEKKKNLNYIADWDKLKGSYYIRIDASGAGCLLIRKRLIERVKKQFHCGLFDVIPPYSEDLSFFYRLKRMNVPVYAAPMIESYHLRMKPISLAEYDPSQLPLDKKIEVV